MKKEKENVIQVFDDMASTGSWEKLNSSHVDRISYNYMSRLRAVEELVPK